MANLAQYRSLQHESIATLLKQAPFLQDPQHNQKSQYQYQYRTYNNESPETGVTPNYSQVKYDAKKDQEDRLKHRGRNSLGSSQSLGILPQKELSYKFKSSTLNNGILGGIGQSSKKEVLPLLTKANLVANNIVKNPLFRIEDMNKNKDSAQGPLGSLWRDPDDEKSHKNKALDEWKRSLASQVQEKQNKKVRDLAAKREEELRDEERFQRNIQDIATHDFRDKELDNQRRSPDPGNYFSQPLINKAPKGYGYDMDFMNERKSPFAKGQYIKQKFVPFPSTSLNMEIDQLKSDILTSQRIFQGQMNGFKEDYEKSNQDRLAIQKNLVSVVQKGGLVQMRGESLDILDDFIGNKGLTIDLKYVQMENERNPEYKNPVADLHQAKMISLNRLTSKVQEFSPRRSPQLGTRQQLRELARRESKIQRNNSRSNVLHSEEDEDMRLPSKRLPSILNHHPRHTRENSLEDVERGLSRSPKSKVSFRGDEREVEEFDMSKNPKSIEKKNKNIYARSEVVMRELEVKLDKSRKALFNGQEDEGSPGYKSKLIGLRSTPAYDLGNDKLLEKQNSVFLDLDSPNVQHQSKRMISEPSEDYSEAEHNGYGRRANVSPAFVPEEKGFKGSLVNKLENQEQFKKRDIKRNENQTAPSGKDIVQPFSLVEERKSKDISPMKRKLR